MGILQDALPGLKRFLGPAKLKSSVLAWVIRCVVAFVMHRGRMGAVRAAGAVRLASRHRAQMCRFLVRHYWDKLALLKTLRDPMVEQEKQAAAPGRPFLFIVDQTLCSHQGRKAENTYSTGNRQRRSRKGRRYHQHRHGEKRCHCFVMGLLIAPSGVRIPYSKSYHTRAYCEQKTRPYRTQAELAAELIAELPEGLDVIVLGDTAFDAKTIRTVCAERGWPWVVPVNPERVLSGKKPHGKVRSLVAGLSANQFRRVRLYPGRGKYVAQRRVSPYRIGPKAKPRTFYVHGERRAVQSVGDVLLVFSTKREPQKTGVTQVEKILMTNDPNLKPAAVVELYDLRWQIELFFKELKSTLGFHQYCFASFEQVEHWVELALVTFLYLEWYRLQQLRRRNLCDKEKRRWQWQRAHGLCLAVQQAAECEDLRFLEASLDSPGGRRRLQRKLAAAVQHEYRATG